MQHKLLTCVLIFLFTILQKSTSAFQTHVCVPSITISPCLCLLRLLLIFLFTLLQKLTSAHPTHASVANASTISTCLYVLILLLICLYTLLQKSTSAHPTHVCVVSALTTSTASSAFAKKDGPASCVKEVSWNRCGLIYS